MILAERNQKVRDLKNYLTKERTEKLKIFRSQNHHRLNSKPPYYVGYLYKNLGKVIIGVRVKLQTVMVPIHHSHDKVVGYTIRSVNSLILHIKVK
jgi:hypothetical protein